MDKKNRRNPADEVVYYIPTEPRTASRPKAARTQNAYPQGVYLQRADAYAVRQNPKPAPADIPAEVPDIPIAAGESEFDGGLLGYTGMNFASLLLFIFTLTLGLAWVLCYRKRWHIHHTIVQGRRLKFTGKGIQLVGNIIKWIFFTLITIGIYGLWLPVKIKKWYAKHIVFDTQFV